MSASTTTVPTTPAAGTLTAGGPQEPVFAGMRPVVAAALTRAAERDPSLVVLAADGHALGAGVRAAFPDRFVDVGIAEATLVGVAAGLARSGRRVVVGTMAPFLVRRAQEQVRNDVCEPGLPVTFLGVGGGLSYGTLGPSHHVVEDLGIFAAMPGTQVFCPADPVAAVWSVEAALRLDGPAYVRLGAREDEVVFDADAALSANTGLLLPGAAAGSARDALIVASGAGVAVARRAAVDLARRGVWAGVLAVTRVSPFPAAQVQELAASVAAISVVEEHVRGSGLSAATALSLAGRWTGSFRVHAVDDRHPPIGDRSELLAFYGIDDASVVAGVLAGLPAHHHYREV